MSLPTPRHHPTDHSFRATCRHCNRISPLDIPAIQASRWVDTPWDTIRHRLVCRECGGKGALLTLNYDDPRYR